MRIWSLHPSLLDTKGLVALWREALLAKHVLKGSTTGYQNHPQLKRFRSSPNPYAAIHLYLKVVYDEAVKRGYSFDKTKFEITDTHMSLPVTKGQIDYEHRHLMNKLLTRDLNKHSKNMSASHIPPHPLFYIVPGEIEDWERVSTVVL